MLTALTTAALMTALPHAVIETTHGNIEVELNETAAPVSVANFIAHARAGHFDGGSFYRTVRDDNEREGVAPMNLIQGGHSFDGLPEAEGIAHESTLETGLTHSRGAISMARDEPGTATTEFFIMVNDYPGLDAGPDGRNPDESGYAVFGAVTEGMDVVERIWMAPASLEHAPESFPYPQFITEPVQIVTVRILDEVAEN
ncbi:peptidylprolyl isomerase [Oceanicaulis sp. LC35]|uniref:peptidylprolyl isomerase n=1 Tax=Oceanicaulis sp. LC35 TaxID=3349635 RepID=UPI003F837736